MVLQNKTKKADWSGFLSFSFLYHRLRNPKLKIPPSSLSKWLLHSKFKKGLPMSKKRAYQFFWINVSTGEKKHVSVFEWQPVRCSCLASTAPQFKLSYRKANLICDQPVTPLPQQLPLVKSMWLFQQLPVDRWIWQGMARTIYRMGTRYLEHKFPNSLPVVGQIGMVRVQVLRSGQNA